jgi:hypothetical protein
VQIQHARALELQQRVCHIDRAKVEQPTNVRCQAEAATAVFQASKAWLRRMRWVLAVVR